MVLFADKLSEDADFIFQQDFTLIHAAYVGKRFMQKEPRPSLVKGNNSRGKAVGCIIGSYI